MASLSDCNTPKKKFKYWKARSFGGTLRATLALLIATTLVSCGSVMACSSSNWVNLIGGQLIDVSTTYVAPDDKDNLFVAS